MDPRHGGAYAAQGPLDAAQIEKLEPTIDFGSGEQDIFYFPQEGHVDPFLAVEAIRKAAETSGVRFVGSAEATDLIRHPNTQRVVGVKFRKNSLERDHYADVVIIANGANAYDPKLAALPVLFRPGTIVFASSPQTETDRGLSRIVVDEITQSHMLYRGSQFIVGGGVLEFGGQSPTTSNHRPSKHKMDKQKEPNKAELRTIGETLLESASRVAPNLIQPCTLKKIRYANRPIPSDGLPAIGYKEDGLYVVVSHSGITLGPLLGEIAAMELCNGVSCLLVEGYRPTRFFEKSKKYSPKLL